MNEHTCETSDTASVYTALFYVHTHCYALKRTTGNQHQRTEHRECSCGSKRRLVTRWSDRTAKWSEPGDTKT